MLFEIIKHAWDKRAKIIRKININTRKLFESLYIQQHITCQCTLGSFAYFIKSEIYSIRENKIIAIWTSRARNILNKTTNLILVSNIVGIRLNKHIIARRVTFTKCAQLKNLSLTRYIFIWIFTLHATTSPALDSHSSVITFSVMFPFQQFSVWGSLSNSQV